MDLVKSYQDATSRLSDLKIDKTVQNSSKHKATSPKAVNFTPNPESEKRRTKYLTAKYGTHQMALIRKRLKVEMWMFDQLQVLSEAQAEPGVELDIDLDEVLDIEEKDKRREHLQEILTKCKSAEETINKFVDALLVKMETL